MKPLIMTEHVKKIAYKNINIWRSYSNLNEAMFREVWSFGPETVKIGLREDISQKICKNPQNAQKLVLKYVIEFEIIFQPLFKLFKNITVFKSYVRSKLGGFWCFVGRNTK